MYRRIDVFIYLFIHSFIHSLSTYPLLNHFTHLQTGLDSVRVWPLGDFATSLFTSPRLWLILPLQIRRCLRGSQRPPRPSSCQDSGSRPRVPRANQAQDWPRGQACLFGASSLHLFICRMRRSRSRGCAPAGK